MPKPATTRKTKSSKITIGRNSLSIKKAFFKEGTRARETPAKQEVKNSQLLNPPSSADGTASSEYALKESEAHQDDPVAVVPLPGNRKRRQSKIFDGAKVSKLKTARSCQSLPNSKKEWEFIDALGTKKVAEHDSDYDELSSNAGISILSGLPRDGLRLRGPPPKAEGMKFTNRHNFAFKYDPFPKHKVRSPKVHKKVLDALIDKHGRTELGLEIDPNTEMPAHAGDEMTVHAIVKVIMSQNTANVNAEVALEKLRAHFTYGETGIVGKVPNYHKARTCALSELQDVVRHAGMWRKRGIAIQGVLNMLYRENLRHLGLEDHTPEAVAANGQNTPEAAEDFVEGLLSLDRLRRTANMQELFDKLSLFASLGVKTIMCIMGFNLHLPCFAVDTHVYRISDMLNWFPHGANINKAAMHMDSRIPNELKYELHQAFWHHGRTCLRCKGGTNEGTNGYKEERCPIEKFKVQDWDWDRKVMEKGETSRREAIGGDYVDAPDADNAVGLDKVKKAKTTPRIKKTPKIIKVTQLEEVDEEEMIRQGYVKMAVSISDNFGTSRADNMGMYVFWELRIPKNMTTETIAKTVKRVETGVATDLSPAKDASRSITIERQKGGQICFRGVAIWEGKATRVATDLSPAKYMSRGTMIERQKGGQICFKGVAVWKGQATRMAHSLPASQGD